MFRDWMRSRLGLNRPTEQMSPNNPMPVGPLRPQIGTFKPGPFDSVNRPMGNTGVVPPHMQPMHPHAQNPMGSYNLEGSVGYGNPMPVPAEIGSGPGNPMPRRDDDFYPQRPIGRYNPFMW